MSEDDNTTFLSRHCSMLRTWSFTYNDNTIELEAIRIYADGKILFDTQQGWLKDEHNGDLDALEIPKVTRALKEDLSRKDCYFIKGRRQYSFDKSYILYINLNTVGWKITDGKLVKKFSTPTIDHYYREFVISGLDGRYLDGSKCTSINLTKHESQKLRTQATRIVAARKRLEKIFSHVSDYDVEKFLKEFKEVK